MTQPADDSRDELERDRVVNKHVFSCVNVARTFNLPDVSVVSPINVAKLALQLCNHPGRSKVEYILNGCVMGSGWDFTPIPSLLSQLKRTALRLLSTPLSLIDTSRKKCP